MEVPNPQLMLIADIELAGDRLKTILEAALEAGCRWIMVRGKNTSDMVVRETVSMALRASGKYGAWVYVSGYPQLVSMLGAHGLHLPWGWRVAESRRIVGGDVVIGMSTHSLEEAEQAYHEGADYITLSPIYRSISKRDYDKILGLHELRKVALRIPIPVIALGGISPGRALPCLVHGAGGVAVMGAVIQSADPYHVVKMLVDEVSGPKALSFRGRD